MNSQGYPPGESLDNYNTFTSNPAGTQDSTVRFRGQGNYQGRISANELDISIEL